MGLCKNNPIFIWLVLKIRLSLSSKKLNTMAAKIFNLPEGFEVPRIHFFQGMDYRKEVESKEQI